MKVRVKMATRLSERGSVPTDATPKGSPQEPTAQEWRDAYEWYCDLQRRRADGSLWNLPPMEERFERMGFATD